VAPQNPRPSTDRADQEEEHTGTVRVAPEVLATIAALTAQSVPGVVRLEGGFAGEVGKLIRRGRSLHGVKVTVVGSEVWVELHLIVKPDVSMYQTGREVQQSVAQALETMVGMPVHAVDVYIEDVDDVSTDAPRSLTT
jgi:uncharacterized alkaline shock family protein YloU